MRARITSSGKVLTFAIVGLMASTALAATSAKTGWSVNRVSSANAGSYCTMAQKYSDEAVVTLAKNPNGQYSVAFDLPSKTFDPSKGTQAVITAGTKVITSAAKPQSENVLVLGVGSDSDFISELNRVGVLKLAVAGKNFEFATAKVQTASEQLNKCVASLNAPSAPAAVSAPLPDVAKTEDVSPKTTVISSPIKDEVSKSIPSELDNLAAENARLKQALNETRQRYEAPASANTATISELQEKLRIAEESLARANAQAKAPTVPPAELAALQTENAALKAQVDKTNQEVGKLQAVAGQAQKQNQQTEQMKAQLATLTQERDSLKVQLEQTTSQIASLQKAPKVEPVDTQKLAVIEKQNADLTAKLNTANQEVTKLQAQLAATPTPAPVVSNATPDQSKALQDQLAQAQQKITQLQAQLDTKATPASIISPQVAQEQDAKIKALESENAALKTQMAGIQTAAAPSQDDNEKLRELRSQLQMMESENKALEAQLNDVQSKQDESQIKSAGNNWDLEQATRRYQESQREIRRLGALLQTQKSSCVGEKKQIESMLFDPAVAEKAQVVKFSAMEDRIASLEDQLRASGVEPAAGASDIVLEKPELKNPSAVPVAPVASSVVNDMPVPTGAPSATQKAAATINPVVADGLGVEQPKISATPQQAQAALTFQSQQDFARLLKDSGVATKDGVRPVQGANSPSYQAFRWKTNALQGSAEQRSLASAGEFQAGVEQYLDRARARCKGEFAAVPASVPSSATGAKLSAYEIACVGGKTGSSASLLFSADGNVMTTIAFEGKADAMAQAIEARDNVANQFGSLKTASR